MIELTDVTYYYPNQDQPALHDIDLSVAAARFAGGGGFDHHHASYVGGLAGAAYGACLLPFSTAALAGLQSARRLGALAHRHAGFGRPPGSRAGSRSRVLKSRLGEVDYDRINRRYLLLS